MLMKESSDHLAKRESRRKRANWFTIMLVCAVVLFLALVSVQERSGGDLGLPKLSELELVRDLLGVDPETTPASTDPDIAEHLANTGVTVHFIDVGQGKCILIEAPEKNVLIDAGENDQGQKALRYFSTRGIDRIDIVIGTHPHSDHIGGMSEVISGIPVSTVILPVIPDDIVPATVTYTSLLNAIAGAGLKITPAKSGAVFDLGGGAELAILGPLNDYEDLNNMSVVSRLSYGQTSFLFTGDAMAAAERDMMEAGKNLRASMLDVGHHGSSTSSSAKFLAAVDPGVAVISCGIDNRYGHPHREVVERLTERESKILRTDLNGTVIISSDGKSLGVETDK